MAIVRTALTREHKHPSGGRKVCPPSSCLGPDDDVEVTDIFDTTYSTCPVEQAERRASLAAERTHPFADRRQVCDGRARLPVDAPRTIWGARSRSSDNRM